VAKLIKENGSEQKIVPKTLPHFTLEELQKAVGGYIEFVRVREASKTVVVNEEGRLNGSKRNPRATLLLAGMGCTANHELYGPVLFCNDNEIDWA